MHDHLVWVEPTSGMAFLSAEDESKAQALPAESFRTFQSARSGEVLRGVSFTPGTREGGR